jgi:hypothetical protein
MTPFERISEFLKVAKDFIKDGTFEPKNGEWPELYPGYAKACRERELIALHSTSDRFPKLAFERLLKNMDENGLKWLEDNYQPVTHGVYNDFLNTVSRATHNIVVEDSGVEERVLEYLYEDLPEYDNINSYNKRICPSLIIQDAMAVFAIVPEKIETREIDESNAEITGDINPFPQYYECFRVISMDKNHCLILSSDKSVVKYGNTERRTGFVFHYFDNEYIIRIEQVGKQTDYNFSEVMVFPHELDFMPALRAGGIPYVVDNRVAYTSHFFAAVPHLNLAMHDSVYLSSVKRKCAFPTAVMVTDECSHVETGKSHCQNGSIRWFEEGEEKSITCPSCKGTGKGQSLNPFSVMFAPAASREVDTKYTANDVLSYVSPDPATMKFLREETELQLTKAAQELKISRSTSQDGGNVTATERGIDLKATYAFIKSFADILVSRWNWQIDVITLMKFGDISSPKVLDPHQFDLKSTEDYIYELKLAKDAGLSSLIQSKLLSDYLYSVYEGSPTQQRFVETIIHADRLLAISDMDLITLKENIEPWEAVLHTSAFVLTERLIAANSDWIEKDLEERVEDLQNAAKAATPVRVNPAIESLI